MAGKAGHGRVGVRRGLSEDDTSMDVSNLLLLNLVVVLAAMVVLWLASVAARDASIVDPFWGTGFIVVTWVTFVFSPAPASRRMVIALLVTAWGARLSGYLAWRNLGKGEDRRYRQMRDKWKGKFIWVSLVTVFVLQGVLMWTISLPIQIGMRSEPISVWLTGVGVLIFASGLLFESIGDYQLARFKSNPSNAGQVLDHGLWRYTRHPNYFGDFLVWWGIYVVAGMNGQAWWTVVSPILMSLLLVYVSGVALLEKSLKERSPKYRDYVQRTSAFFPWPPDDPGPSMQQQ